MARFAQACWLGEPVVARDEHQLVRWWYPSVVRRFRSVRRTSVSTFIRLGNHVGKCRRGRYTTVVRLAEARAPGRLVGVGKHRGLGHRQSVERICLVLRDGVHGRVYIQPWPRSGFACLVSHLSRCNRSDCRFNYRNRISLATAASSPGRVGIDGARTSSRAVVPNAGCVRSFQERIREMLGTSGVGSVLWLHSYPYNVYLPVIRR